jgi:hypothetical protein
MKKVLHLPDKIPVPKTKLISSKNLGNTRLEKFLLLTEDSLQLPAVTMKPLDPGKKIGAVLYLHERGKVNGIERLRKLKDRNLVVMTMDVRGYEEEVSPFPYKKRMPEKDNFQLFWEKHGDGYLTAESYELGLPLFGLRVADVVRGLKYLKSLPEVNPEKIVIFGEGDDALLALHAGLLEYWVHGIVVNNFLGSWLSLTQTDNYCQSPFIFIPDILRYYDVPHLVTAMTPKMLILSNPRDAKRQNENIEQYRTKYPQFMTIYKQLYSENNLVISQFSDEDLLRVIDDIFN